LATSTLPSAVIGAVRNFSLPEFVRLGDLLVPDDLAGIAVDGDHPAVGQVGDHEIVPQRDAARARDVALMAHAGIADPDELALVRVAGVDLVHRAPAVGGVHEAVVDQRIDFILGTVLADILHAAERQRPHHPQILDVVAIDLGQLGVAHRAVVAVHHQPVLRLVLRVDQPVPIDRHRVLGRERGCGDRGRRRAGENRNARKLAHVSHD
jgi:hypothetical protein